jgi:predicted Ser/Thr protein kinase
VYKRLQGEPNFPQLLSYDERRSELVISHCGPSLDTLGRKRMVVPDLEQQIDRIEDALDRHGIKHLDVLPKNVCLQDGQIHLIDFDLAVLDGNPAEREAIGPAEAPLPARDENQGPPAPGA